eukprot:371091_1
MSTSGTKETDQQKKAETETVPYNYGNIIVTIILIMNIICLLGVMASMIGIYSELKTTYPGCCGLIESHDDDESNPIPGSPTVCTIDVIDKYDALIIQTFVVDNEPIYYCSVLTNADMNATLCNTFDEGTIESCLQLNGYALSDVCSLSAIDEASADFNNKHIINYYIASIASSVILVLYWLPMSHAIYRSLWYDDQSSFCFSCDLLFEMGFGFASMAEMAYYIVYIVYFAEDYDHVTTGATGSNAESWMMDTCSENNYPVLLDITEFNDSKDTFCTSGLAMASIGLVCLAVGFLRCMCQGD